MAHDVFISYSSKDKPAADAVCAKLEASAIRCWIAPRDILPGEEWGGAILDGLDNARLMIVVFSSHANASHQIRREVERAVNKGLVIITFRIEDVTPERSLEYFLSTPHWLDALTPPLEAHLDYLADTVKLLLDRRKAADAVKPRVVPASKPSRTSLFTPLNIAFAVVLLTAAAFGVRQIFPTADKAVPLPIQPPLVTGAKLQPTPLSHPAVSIAGSWVTADGGPAELAQVGSRVTGTYRGVYPHAGMVGAIHGDFDGANFVGTYENREGTVGGNGSLTLALTDKGLEGVWASQTSPGQSGAWVMHRKTQGCFEAAGDPAAGSTDREAHLNWARQNSADRITNNIDWKIDVVSGCMTSNPEQWASVFGKVSAIIANAVSDPKCFGGDPGAVIRDESSHKSFAMSREHDFVRNNLKWKAASAMKCLDPDGQRVLFADISAALSASVSGG